MTKVNRCVHLFPRFINNNVIEDIRKKYDNLYGLIEPHITIVFPFESTIEKEELVEEIQKVIRNEISFEVTAKSFEAIDAFGYYLFLNIEEGQKEIKKLHYKMHEGLLGEYQSPWTKDGSFKPHITIGRFENKEELEKAFEEVKNLSYDFRTVVDKVYVEIIGDDDESIIESIIKY